MEKWWRTSTTDALEEWWRTTTTNALEVATWDPQSKTK
jgi:hypothetical protein